MRTCYPDPFIKISDDESLGILQNVLKQRLPRSAHEYNMIINKRQFHQDVKVFCLDGDLSENTVVIMINFRKDYGQDINMSVPTDYIPDDYLREALILTKIIDWEEAYIFTSLDRVVSPLVVEISTSVKKNSVQVNPNYQYGFDVNEALRQDFRNLQDDIEIRPLDKISGAKFLLDNWKYSKDGSQDYVHKVLESNPSAGVYVKGVLTCGALVNVHGLIGLLYTDVHYRRMGLAQLCMRYLFKEMARTGLVPTSSAQAKNYMSCNFHEKLGMKITHETDYVYHTPYTEGRHNG